jgi:hypothetical protein
MVTKKKIRIVKKTRKVQRGGWGFKSNKYRFEPSEVKKSKIAKVEISAPVDFKHLVHTDPNAKTPNVVKQNMQLGESQFNLLRTRAMIEPPDAHKRIAAILAQTHPQSLTPIEEQALQRNKLTSMPVINQKGVAPPSGTKINLTTLSKNNVKKITTDSADFFNQLQTHTDINDVKKIAGLFTGVADIQPKINEYLSELVIKQSNDEDIKFIARRERKIDKDRAIYETIRNFKTETPEAIALKLSFHYRFNTEQSPIIKEIDNNNFISPETKNEIKQKLDEFTKIQRDIGSIKNLDDASIENLKKKYKEKNPAIIDSLIYQHKEYINPNAADSAFYNRLYTASQDIEKQTNEDNIFDKMKDLKQTNLEQYKQIFDLFLVPSGESANKKVETMYKEYTTILADSDSSKKQENLKKFFIDKGLTDSTAQNIFIQKLEFDHKTTHERRALDELMATALKLNYGNNVAAEAKQKYLEANRKEIVKQIQSLQLQLQQPDNSQAPPQAPPKKSKQKLKLNPKLNPKHKTTEERLAMFEELLRTSNIKHGYKPPTTATATATVGANISKRNSDITFGFGDEYGVITSPLPNSSEANSSEA